ncbi:MAG: AraC family transcriptional regulator [Rhizobiales bacterium]|nr:AraC family transcriptional regulator [Hyphomicrobiales bacterium]
MLHRSATEIYPVNKLVALVAALAEEGIPAELALRGTGIDEHELRSPTSRMSLAQLLAGYRNAMELSRDPHFALRLGRNIRVTAYGMYGYAMLSSPDRRTSYEFVQKYHRLSAPTVDLTFREEDGFGIWTIKPFLTEPVDSRLYQFVVEVMLGTITALSRDLVDSSYKPAQIRIAYPKLPRLPSYEQFFDCPVLFDQDSNELRLDAAWLDVPTLRPNELTFASVQQICSEMLAQMDLATGIAGELRRILLESTGRFPTIEEACRRLGTSPRTLRRKLIAQGTSYLALLNETRAHLAKKYLRETAMTVEEIADRIGYSEASNFRHAFQRWVGVTPAQYRRNTGKGAKAVGPAVLAS